MPIFWIVAPLSVWTGVLSLGGLVSVAIRRFMRIQNAQINSDLTMGIFCLALGLVSVVWSKNSGEQVSVLRGGISLTLQFFGCFLALVIAAMLALHWLSRLTQNKAFTNKFLTVSALSLGSFVFCIPLIWLLLTSFKEQRDNTAGALIWVPMVTKTFNFYDPDRPLYESTWKGQKVLATQVSRLANVVELEVERPFPLKGWRFQAAIGSLVEVPRKSEVVWVDDSFRIIQCFVRRQLPGGLLELESLSTFPRRKFQVLRSETHPVQQVGIRWENYSESLEWLPAEAEHGLTYLRNTLILVVLSVFGTILSCSFVAYGFSRLRFPGRTMFFFLMLASMMLPGAVTMLPRFLIWKGLGAIDTLIPIWLPAFTASAFNVFLLREFFRTIPMELEDAARIDGCSPIRTYWQIMLPQIKPALTVIGIWAFMGAWNDFMTPLIYVSSPEKMPISYAIQLFASEKGGEFGYVMAFATMSMIPVLLVFLFGQKYFVEGVQLSGLGGK